MSRRPSWSEAECEKLLRLRDKERWDWPEIEEAMPGRTLSACKVQYYGILKSRNAAKRIMRSPRSLQPLKPSPAVSLGRVPAAPVSSPPIAEPVVPVRRALPAEPARGSAAVSTGLLIADAEMRSRIAVLGITGGLLGDPAPGRSALDKPRAKEWCGR